MLDYCIHLMAESNQIISQMINSIPVNNSNVKWLSKHLYETYNKEKWNAITLDTFAFKLDWRQYNKHSSETPNTYYKEIVEKYVNG